MMPPNGFTPRRFPPSPSGLPFLPRLRGFLACAAAAALLFSCANPSRDNPAADDTGLPETPLWDTVGSADYVSPREVSIDEASLSNQATGLEEDWYLDSSFYHVWVKSFSDSDGDGCGDLVGITAKLGYIQDTLGCDAIWLSPIFDCASKGTAPSYNMHGYDTVDYYRINPLFGDESDVADLLAAAHARGMKVIFDFVPNHTSTEHQWFRSSVADRDSDTGGMGSWYLWQNAALPWNPMGSSATWARNASRGQYYYAPFWSGMPDLNYRNLEVREEMKNVARYWLNRGFDGMRIDAVRYLREEPNQWADTAATHQWFAELRSEVVDAYGDLGHPKFMIGEAWINGNRPLLESYFGSAAAPEFEMLFDFDFAGRVLYSVFYEEPGFYFEMYAGPKTVAGTGIAAFLSNHDNLSNRPATIYGDPWSLRLASALALLRPAVPFIYYGNEIGQKDAAGYTGEDIRLRYPFDWSSQALQEGDSDSLLAYHRALLSLREEHPALRRGEPTVLMPPSGQTLDVTAYAYALSSAEETLVAVANFGSAAISETLSLDLSPLGVPAGCTALFGNPEGASVTGNVLTVQNLPGRAIRLYRVDLPSASPASDLCVQENDGSRMYLRGSMNGWAATTPMARVAGETDEIWTVSLALTGGTEYAFKFDSSGAASNWPLDQNWGSPAGSAPVAGGGTTGYSLSAGGDNIEFTPETTGNWSFTFNKTLATLEVSLSG